MLLEEVVAAAAALQPRPEISLTTNGVGLARRAAGLAAAGLNRVNVSLDSVDRDISRPSPVATGSMTCWTAWPPPRRPA